MATILGNTEFDDAAAAAAARKSYLKKFYQAEIVEPIEAIEEDETGLEMGGEAEEEPEADARAERDEGRQGEARGPSAKEVAEARRAAAAQRSAARRQMEQQVAGTGVLGVLSAGGGGGSGDAVADVLGDAGGGTSLVSGDVRYEDRILTSGGFSGTQWRAVRYGDVELVRQDGVVTQIEGNPDAPTGRGSICVSSGGHDTCGPISTTVEPTTWGAVKAQFKR